MNFLQLCQRTAKEAGLEADTPSTVVGQTGDEALIVNWVLSAYREIAEKHRTWKFLWSEFSKDTVAGNDSLALPTNCRRPAVQDCIAYLKTAGISEGWNMTYKEFTAFRRQFRFPSTSNAQPQYITQTPDGSLQVYPTPDDIYTIEFGGWRSAPDLAADSDEPLIPEEYRMAIVWRAVILAGGHHEAASMYQAASASYQHQMRLLESTQLPDIIWAADAIA